MLLSIETVYYGQIMEHDRAKLPIHLVRNSLSLMVCVATLAIIANVFLGAFVLSFLKVGLSDALHIYLLMLAYYALLAFISIFSKVLIGWGIYRLNIILAVLCTTMILTLSFFGNTGLEAFVLVLVSNAALGSIAIG